MYLIIYIEKYTISTRIYWRAIKNQPLHDELASKEANWLIRTRSPIQHCSLFLNDDIPFLNRCRLKLIVVFKYFQ